MPDNSTLSVLPEFVNLDYKLYQYTGNGKYILIDTLGTFGYTEYDQNRFNVNSMILNNKSNKTVPIKQPKTDTRDSQEKGIDEVVNNQKPIDRAKKYNLEDISDSLSIISSTSTNKLHRELAKQILANLNSPPKVVISNDPTVRGSFNYSTNIITINPSTTYSDEDFEKVILHELIHNLTGYTIKEWQFDPNSVTKEQDRIITSLDRLSKAFINKINEDPIKKKEFEDFIKAFKEGKGISEFQISKYYGAYDLREFVTMAMTDMDFQKILNNIPFNSTKTMLDRFIELVKNILNSMGFKITPGSILEHSVENIVELINLTNPEYVEDKQTNKLQYVLPDGKTIYFNDQQYKSRR